MASPTNVAELRERLGELLPGFAAFCGQFGKHGRGRGQAQEYLMLFAFVGQFISEHDQELTTDVFRRFGQLINECIAGSDQVLAEQAVLLLSHPCVVPHLTHLGLSDLAGAKLRQEHDLHARTERARVVFDEVAARTQRLVSKAGIDFLSQPFLVNVLEAKMARLMEMMRGPSEKVVLARVAKPFLKEHLPQFRWLRDREWRLQLEKPFEGDLRIALHIDKDPAYQVGKLFTVDLGVTAESGPYANVWLMREIAELVGHEPRTHCWRYNTNEDVKEVLGAAISLVSAVLPLFEQAVREVMLPDSAGG